MKIVLLLLISIFFTSQGYGQKIILDAMVVSPNSAFEQLKIIVQLFKEHEVFFASKLTEVNTKVLSTAAENLSPNDKMSLNGSIKNQENDAKKLLKNEDQIKKIDNFYQLIYNCIAAAEDYAGIQACINSQKEKVEQLKKDFENSCESEVQFYAQIKNIKTDKVEDEHKFTLKCPIIFKDAAVNGVGKKPVIPPNICVKPTINSLYCDNFYKVFENTADKLKDDNKDVRTIEYTSEDGEFSSTFNKLKELIIEKGQFVSCNIVVLSTGKLNYIADATSIVNKKQELI